MPHARHSRPIPFEHELVGDRVVLQPYQPADALAVWQAIDEARPVLARWVPDIGRRSSPAEVQVGLAELVRARSAGERFVFGLWHRETASFLGEVGLYAIDWASRHGELGYWLRPSAQRRGFATEGVRLLLAHAIAELGLSRFEAHIAPANHASRRVAETVGFTVGDRRPGSPRWDGGSGEILIYVLLASELAGGQ